MQKASQLRSSSSVLFWGGIGDMEKAKTTTTATEKQAVRKYLAALYLAFRFSLEIYRQLAVLQPKGADFIVDHRLIIPNHYREVLEHARQHQSDVTAIPRFCNRREAPLRSWEPLVRATTVVEG
jgi:hypothetical protein